MAARKPVAEPHTVYHKNGTLWARGQLLDGQPIGYWEWFRKDGTKLRSGTIDESGQQVGEWTTYDAKGEVYKVTRKKGGQEAAKKTAKKSGKA